MKTIKSLIKYIQTNESTTLEDLKNNNSTLYEGMNKDTYELIENSIDDIITLNNTDYKYLKCNSTYYNYNDKYIKYCLFIDYLEYTILDPNKYKSFTEFKRVMIKEGKEEYCS